MKRNYKIKLARIYLATHIVIFILLSLSICLSRDRTREIDSLKNELKKFGNDINRVNILNAIAYTYDYEPITMKKYCNDALELAIKLNFRQGEANSYHNLAVHYWKTSNYSKGLEYYFKSLKINKELGNKRNIAWNLMGIGIVYYFLSDYPKALDYHLRSLKVFEEIGWKTKSAANLENIASIYFELQNLQKSLEYALKSIKVYEDDKDLSGIARNLVTVGQVYLKKSDYPKALDNLFRALEINRMVQHIGEDALNLGTIGETYIKLSMDTSFHNLKENNEHISIIKEINLKRGIEYTLRAVEISNSNKDLFSLANWYRNLYYGYKQFNDIDKALFYHELYQTTKDSVFNKENTSKIANLITNFEVEKKQRENELLKKDKTLQTSYRNFFIIISILTILLAIGLFNRYLHKKKTGKILQEKNQKLEEANIELDRSYKEKIELQKKAFIQENQVLMLKSQMLENDLESKQKELTTLALYLAEKNECLLKLKEQATQIFNSTPKEIPKVVKTIISTINYKLNSEESWAAFEEQFKQLHHGFIEELSGRYPDLTLSELKVCALLKINLSTKEIASLLSVSNRTVEDHRLNIRRKLGLNKNINLSKYFSVPLH